MKKTSTTETLLPRPGAGRPVGTGKYAEATRTLRVPNSAMPMLERYLSQYRLQRLAASIRSQAMAVEPPESLIREAGVRVSAGLPMPSDDEHDDGIDLNQLLVRRPDKTQLFTVEGDSMDRVGICEGDKLIVDCGLEARDGDIVIAIILGEGHMVKRLSTKGRCPCLVPESTNPRYQIRELKDADEWVIWGVVTNLIKRFR